MIGDLPDLQDLERRGGQYDYDPNGFSNQNGLPEEKLQKFLRNTYQPRPESGMGQPATYSHAEFEPARQVEQQQYIPPQAVGPQLNCLDVANHVQGCPICSKFYHNDKTMYIVAIVVLLLICLMLLKRVLNV